jgi:hypothetical protein
MRERSVRPTSSGLEARRRLEIMIISPIFFFYHYGTASILRRRLAPAAQVMLEGELAAACGLPVTWCRPGALEGVEAVVAWTWRRRGGPWQTFRKGKDATE